jgi:hypothetical protein
MFVTGFSVLSNIYGSRNIRPSPAQSAEFLDILKPVLELKEIYKCSPYLTENTLHPSYKDGLILFKQESYDTR